MARSTRLRRLALLSFVVALVFPLFALFALFAEGTAHAADSFVIPPLNGHVVDSAGALSDLEARQLDMKLDRARRDTGFAIVVYLLPHLPDGRSIEDVGYLAGNTWGVGSKKGDDGVILIAALGDHKLRIETGKGVGGALTDVEASHIDKEVIGPPLREGRTYEAMSRGVDAILNALVTNTPGGVSDPGRAPNGAHPAAAKPMTVMDYAKTGAVILVILGVIILAIVSPAFRELLFFIFLFGRGGGGGSGGGGGGGGGSGYGGGGGSFGGGGSSDDY